MADESPPRRIGQLTPHPLHAPAQRHHPDPAASRDQIRTLPNAKGHAGLAEPDAGDSGAATNASHADGVRQLMQDHTAGMIGYPESGSPPVITPPPSVRTS